MKHKLTLLKPWHHIYHSFILLFSVKQPNITNVYQDFNFEKKVQKKNCNWLVYKFIYLNDTYLSGRININI